MPIHMYIYMEFLKNVREHEGRMFIWENLNADLWLECSLGLGMDLRPLTLWDSLILLL